MSLLINKFKAPDRIIYYDIEDYVELLLYYTNNTDAIQEKSTFITDIRQFGKSTNITLQLKEDFLTINLPNSFLII